MAVRALYRAVKIESAAPPFDTLMLKIYYPAAPISRDAERNTGNIPPDASRARFPVALFFSAVNVGLEGYQWLAVELAERGMAVVCFNWVNDQLPGGQPGLSPGVDLRFMTPATYGAGPTGVAIPALLAELERMQAGGPLAGLLDLDRIVLGGHSAGGSVALLNANRSWFPQVVAAFAYGAHTQASTMLGFAPGTVLALAADVPLLVLGGDRDGVIAASAGRYGQGSFDNPGDPILPLRRTFDDGISGARSDRYLMILAGANHFSFIHPHDETTGRGFLDWPAEGDAATTRALLGKLVCEFLAAHVAADRQARVALVNRVAQPQQELVLCECK
jgi:predicted dienelactone hydrolase